MPFPSLLAVTNPTYLDFFAALKYLIHSLGMMRIHSCDAARRRHWMTLLTAVSMTWWSLYQMDLDRTLFLLRSYLRLRLQKVGCIRT